LELVDLLILAVTPPEEVQKMIDERAGMGAVGDVDRYVKYKAAQSLPDAAKQPGGAAGQGLGLGLGFGLGEAMAGALRPEPGSNAAGERAPVPPAGAEVAVTSEPGGADIYVDGQYEGSTPSQLSMIAGEHAVRVARPGYRDWERKVRVSAGAKKSINAVLEKA
jgi:hypothetical protein